MPTHPGSLRDLVPLDLRAGRNRGAPGRSPQAGVLIGLGAIAAAVLLKLAINRMTGSDVLYLPFFVVLPVAVIAGGMWAGATLALAGVAVDAAVFDVARRFDPSAAARLLLFVPTSLWLTLLIASLAHHRHAAATEADRLSAIIRGLPGFAILADRGGRIRYVSEAIERLGWDPASLLGRTVGELLPDLPSGAAGAGEAPITIDLVGRDGTAIAVEVIRVPVAVGPGAQGVLIAARDVSDQAEKEFQLVRLAAAERRTTRSLHAVIGSMDAGVALVQPDGTIALRNDALSAIAPGVLATRADLERALGMPIEPGEAHVASTGRWLRLAVHDLEDGELVIVRDLTEERTAAAAQEAFMGILSHELRTPITTILGLAHLIGRQRTAGLTASEVASDIVGEAERLSALVEDLLVLSRSQRGRVTYDPEPILVQHAIGAVVAQESLRYPHVTFATEVDRGLPPAEGDRTFLTQVLRNIVGNAAKYSPTTPCTVTISARASDTDLEVRVLDEGPGFEEGEAERLFDIFFRSNRTARARAGSGIGLYVSRTLVEAMGGRIWARLRPEGGSEFGFSLPILSVPDLAD